MMGMRYSIVPFMIAMSPMIVTMEMNMRSLRLLSVTKVIVMRMRERISHDQKWQQCDDD
ncbi:hypothetical protein [Rhodopirellula sp. MGV]|uniref:hypothetical protein n=1 Tax=Rhodopirellula sp. MGV TaxID=2023130 RepID=UPI001E53B1B5|nr:hypothetical protein [Rhodopirellula sp. MGV]